MGFNIDFVSAWNAKWLAYALGQRHRAVVRNVSRSLSEDFTHLPELVSSCTGPLERMAKGLPLSDVRTDVQEFGLLVMLAQIAGSQLPALLIDTEAAPVPLLPPQSFLVSTLNGEYFSADQLELNFREFVQAASEMNGYALRPVEYVQKMFFRGLQHFLAARIAGVRWARKLPSHMYEEYRLAELGVVELAFAGGGGGGAEPPEQSSAANRGAGVYQRWTVHSVGGGNSLYWGGTHAAHTSPIYLNGLTTPLDVDLPTGTLYLAADAGPGGSYVWDNAIITVPSLNTIYYTKRF
jgi:hypothetical protein